MSKRKTREQVIEEFINVHGNLYDYSEFIYVNAKTKGVIRCRKHNHKFPQSADSHKRGSGCPTCAKEKSDAAKYTSTEDYLEKFKKTHGDRYKCLDKRLISDELARFECSIHGEFKQTPVDHSQGRGCPSCAKEVRALSRRLGREEIIRQSIETHGDSYGYDKMMCEKITEEGEIWCKKHKEYFPQYMVNHVRGSGCPKCGSESSNKAKHDDQESFELKVKEVFDNLLDFSNFVYEGTQIKGEVRCVKHNYTFDKTPNDLIQGIGCPKCSNTVSKGEYEIEEFLKSLIKVKKRNRKVLSGNKEIDIWIPEKNIGIEYNGLYWHSDRFKEDKYHLNKTEEVELKGYKLIHIFEDEWLNKKDIVKSRLKNIVGATEGKIFARKTKIKSVDSKTASRFLRDNHLQGNVNSSIRIGLYHKEELVALCTFGKLRKNMGNKDKENVYELYRFCNKLNTNVIGGASKLLKHFIKEYQPKEIVSYADRRWSNGDLYKSIGFELIGKTKPNYFYTKGMLRENRFNYRKDVLVSEGFDKNKTEREIMKGRGYSRIYDCGTLKFNYKI